MYEIPGKFTTATVMLPPEEIDSGLIAQLIQMVNNPACTNPIVIQPDTHVGKGCVIGFCMKLTDKLIPNFLGVDIACGLLAVELEQAPGLDFLEIDRRFRRSVPFGTHVLKTPVVKEFYPFNLPKIATQVKDYFNSSLPVPTYDTKYFKELCKRVGVDENRALCSVGTLGGGNHFIELNKSQTGKYWLVIHSGSRNLGLKVCNYWQQKAIKNLKAANSIDVEALKEQFGTSNLDERIRELKDSRSVVQKGMEYLQGDDLVGYLYDMIFIQEYAALNRITMAAACMKDLNQKINYTIETTHNYISFKDMVMRKGAISAHRGEEVVIPLNMRDGTLICRGKGNPDWLNSAPHGAGRVLSRSQAKEKLSLDQFQKDMEGIASTSVHKRTLDEAPRAYKDAQLIIDAIGPTVEIIDHIKPVLNMKA